MCNQCKIERTEDTLIVSVIKETTRHPPDGSAGQESPVWRPVPKIRINGGGWIDLSTKDGLAKFLSKFGL